MENHYLVSVQRQKYMTSASSKPEFLIWPWDTVLKLSIDYKMGLQYES